jgi:hypothetical protein
MKYWPEISMIDAKMIRHRGQESGRRLWHGEARDRKRALAFLWRRR